MKATPSVAKATGLPKSTVNSSPSRAQPAPQDDSIQLSQAGIEKRVSTTTEVLTEILEHDRHSYSFRHWGINE